jgi:hypothetical protein
MKKPKKILLISLIVILVLWFGSNLGLYLITKHIVIREDRLELFNKVPDTIEIPYKEIEGQKIYFGDIEFELPFNNYESVYTSSGININENETDKYSTSLSMLYEYAEKRISIMIYLWNPDLKTANSYIEFANYTFDDFSVWNTLYNYNSFHKLVAKSIFLPSNNDLGKYPLSIVNTKYLKAFWTINSGKKTSSSNIEFSKNDKFYTIYLFGGDDKVITDDMKNIIASIKPIEDKEKVTKELLSDYKNKESLIDKELALTSLISIEGPTIENLTELKNLLIQKGDKAEFIDSNQEQIDILSNNTKVLFRQD